MCAVFFMMAVCMRAVACVCFHTHVSLRVCVCARGMKKGNKKTVRCFCLSLSLFMSGFLHSSESSEKRNQVGT